MLTYTRSPSGAAAPYAAAFAPPIVPPPHWPLQTPWAGGMWRPGLRVAQLTVPVCAHRPASAPAARTAPSGRAKDSLQRPLELQEQLTYFYLRYNPERVDKVREIVAEFSRRGGGAEELEALNDELRQVYRKDLRDTQRERAKDREAAEVRARTFVRAGGGAWHQTSREPMRHGLKVPPPAPRQDIPGHTECSSDELRVRLRRFYSIWSPARSARVEAIVRTFEQRGAGAEALRDLNEELREVYGRDLASMPDTPRTTPSSARRDATWSILRKTGDDSPDQATAQRQMQHMSGASKDGDAQAGPTLVAPTSETRFSQTETAENHIIPTQKAQEGTHRRSSRAGDGLNLSPGSITKTGFLSSAFLGDALERARSRIRERDSERGSDDLHARNGTRVVTGGLGCLKAAADETVQKEVELSNIIAARLRDGFIATHQRAEGGMRDEQPGEPGRAAYTDLEEDQDAAGVENGQGLGAISPLVTKSPMTSSLYSSTASVLASYPYFSSPRESGEKKLEEADNGKDRERFRDVAPKNEESMLRAAEKAVGKGGESASEREGERVGKWQEIMESKRKEIAKSETGVKSRDWDLEKEWEREAKDAKREEVDREDMDKDQQRQRQPDTPNREQDDVTARAAAELELVKEKERERRRREDQVAARCPLYTAIEICSPMPTNTHMFVCFPRFFSDLHAPCPRCTHTTGSRRRRSVQESERKPGPLAPARQIRISRQGPEAIPF
jgi:hypothetical protein